MAVQAVNNLTLAAPPELSEMEVSPVEKDYTNMTAVEIMTAINAGENVPAEIAQWAKDNPESNETYKSVQSVNTTEEQDNISYKDDLDNLGFSLEEQCIILKDLSERMENRDLKNVQRMSPYIQQVPNDEQSGDDTTSEVSNALVEISGIMSGGGFFSKEREQKLEFYLALHSNAYQHLNDIDFSLEEIQKVLDTSIECTNESKQAGGDAIKAGEELKSSSKWWRFGKKIKARKAIKQGELTERMSDSTRILAEAIAKDNNIALSETKNNLQIVEQSSLDLTKQVLDPTNKLTASVSNSPQTFSAVSQTTTATTTSTTTSTAS